MKWTGRGKALRRRVRAGMVTITITITSNVVTVESNSAVVEYR